MGEYAMLKNLYTPFMEKVLKNSSQKKLINKIVLDEMGDDAKRLFSSGESNNVFKFSETVKKDSILFPSLIYKNDKKRPIWAMHECIILFAVSPGRICCIKSIKIVDVDIPGYRENIISCKSVGSKSFSKFIWSAWGRKKITSYYRNYFEWIIKTSEGEDPLNLVRTKLPQDIEGSALRLLTIEKSKEMVKEMN